MADWMVWLILAGILVILELFSGTFYLLMLAVGLVAGALAALGGLGLEAQIIVGALVGMIATVLLHRSRFGWKGRTDSARDPNVNLDIGEVLRIDAWNHVGPSDSRPAARVSYRGALWDVELADEAIAAQAAAIASGARPAPGPYRIVALRGSRLIVAAA